MVENTDIHGLQLPQPSTFRNGCLALMHYIHSMTLVQAIRVARWYICLHTKNSNFGTFLKAWQRKNGTFHGHLVNFMILLVYLCSFGIYFPNFVTFWTLLVYFMVIWYIFYHFGMFYGGKSGNPASDRCRVYNFLMVTLRAEMEWFHATLKKNLNRV
jgi:hypothetical protein